MRSTVVILAIIVTSLNSQVPPEILETFSIEEGKIITESLANLTELLIRKQRNKDEELKGIKIYPLSDSNLYPFRIQSGELLQLSSPVDRESICAEAPSPPVTKVCLRDECCKLFGFQYQPVGEVQTFFILVKIIDINDQEPKFKSIKHPYIKIPENVDERFIIELPQAEDSDSQLYSVKRYSISQIFPLTQMTDFRFITTDSTPPQPRLMVSAALDYERTNKYKFKLTAYDSPPGKSGHSCSIVIEIEIEDINDHSPKFEQDIYDVAINENEPSNQILKWKVVDNDSGKNGMVSVYIDNEEMAKKFQATKSKMNEGSLALITPLDFEKDSRLYQFMLIAQDHGVPPRSSTAAVKIRLVNVNDNAPKIVFKMLGYSTSNTVTIKEGLAAQSLVVEVRVTDADSPNSAISCNLLDFTDIFYLDQPGQHNTLLYYKPYNLKTISTIDRESSLGSFIRITVQCSDGDSYKPLTTNETLNIQVEDVNDNAPQFSQQTFMGTVEENQASANVMFLKSMIATDKDYGANGKIDFSIEDFSNSTDSNKFFCEKDSGKIMTQRPLDFELQNQYRFKLIAKDQGKEPLSNSATIVVNVNDVNDNAPVFPESHYTFTISEDAKVGTKIGVVSATDKDFSPENKIVRYEMDPKSGNRDSIEVDKHSGEIRTRKTLDRESYESISFKIVASNPKPLVNHLLRDMDSEVQIIVKVTDVNDNPPRFQLKPNIKPRIEFLMEQYVEGSTCAELPYTVHDTDDEGPTGPHCCLVSLENDYDNLLSLMTNTPSYICLMRRPLKYQSLTITLIAKDRPADSQKSLTAKISFPVIIKTDPNAKPNNNRLIETTENKEQNPTDPGNMVIIAILTTVVLVFLIIIIIIIIIIRRCSIGNQEYHGGKIIQNVDHAAGKAVQTNNNCLMPETNNILQSGMPGCKMTVPRGYMPSPHYSDSMHKTICRTNHHSQSSDSSPFTPPVYHQILTNQGIRIMGNPRPTADQYVYEWSPNPDEQDRILTVSRSVLNSSSEKVRPLSPTRSESLHRQSNMVSNKDHDSGYQILNPFNTSCSPQRQVLHYSPDGMASFENGEDRSITLLNNFFDEDPNGQSSKTTPMTMKRNYFQTTFV